MICTNYIEIKFNVSNVTKINLFELINILFDIICYYILKIVNHQNEKLIKLKKKNKTINY